MSKVWIAARRRKMSEPVEHPPDRLEPHQATATNRLISADHSPLETTIGYE